MDAQDDLSALRIDRAPRREGRPWVKWVVVLVLAVAVAAGSWSWFSRERPIEVEVATVTERAGRHPGGRAERLGLRHRAAPSDGLVENHRQGRRGERRGRHGRDGRPGARAARRLDRAGRAGAGGGAGRRRRASAVAENEVRLAQAQRHLTRRRGSCSQTGSRRSRTSTRRSADVDVDRGAHRRATRADQRWPSGRSRCSRPSSTTRDPRAVQRRRDLEGRAAGRDGVAGVGRRRLHAHRHLHDRRHAARSRSRSTSTRATSTASRPASTSRAVLDAYPDWQIPGARHHDRPDRRSAEGDGARAHRLQAARPAHPAGHGRQGDVPARSDAVKRRAAAAARRTLVPKAGDQDRQRNTSFVFVVTRRRRGAARRASRRHRRRPRRGARRACMPAIASCSRRRTDSTKACNVIVK